MKYATIPRSEPRPIAIREFKTAEGDIERCASLELNRHDWARSFGRMRGVSPPHAIDASGSVRGSELRERGNELQSDDPGSSGSHWAGLLVNLCRAR